MKIRMTEHTGFYGNKWWTVEQVYKWYQIIDPEDFKSWSFDSYDKALDFYNGLLSGKNGTDKILMENEIPG